MALEQPSVIVDTKIGGIRLYDGHHQPISLHPLWIRERLTGKRDVDPKHHQRLYEHAKFPPTLKITDIVCNSAGKMSVTFNDGYISSVALEDITRELGWTPDPEAPPLPQSWTASENPRPDFDWNNLNTASEMKAMLDDYFKRGYCIMQNTPKERGSLRQLARRFGFLRETNFGELFNVEAKPSPTDLAYTDAFLASHSDNPYRAPVPGIQFLHCLRNEVSGGFSTLVDGMAIAKRLIEESPEQAKALEQVEVRFRYHSPTAILQHHGPIIERDHNGLVRQIRLSSRVDYVPAMDSETLDLFYAGRRRLHELAASDEFQISFPFVPGTLLMMDNYRLLHGRTAFNGKQGHRHLQGCYIDHDGPDCLYRLLARDGKTTSVIRESD